MPFSSACHLIPDKERIALIIRKRTDGVSLRQNILLWLDPWTTLLSFLCADLASWLYLVVLYSWVKECEPEKRKAITGPEVILICAAFASYFLSIYNLDVGYKFGLFLRRLDLEDAFPDEYKKTTCCGPATTTTENEKLDLEAGPQPCHQETPSTAEKQKVDLEAGSKNPSAPPPYIEKPPLPPIEERLAEELAFYRHRMKTFYHVSSLGNFIRSPKFGKLSPEMQWQTLEKFHCDQVIKDSLSRPWK